MQFFSTIASLVACVSAYQVLTPTANSTITKGSTVNVKFSTVDTDASTFSVYLVNFATAHWPPTVLSLAQNVASNAGSVDVRIPCSVDNDSGYQLNFINGTNTYVIYAQSAAFSLTGSCTDPVAGSTAAVYSNSSISTVQTIIYSSPVVWFVQPSNLVAAAAICPPAAQQTVTVQAGPVAQQTVTVRAGPAAVTVVSTATVTKTVTSCPSQAAIVAALAVAAANGGNAVGAIGAAASTTAASSARASTAASSIAAVAAVPVVSTLPKAASSDATKVGGAFVALFGAVAALLL